MQPVQALNSQKILLSGYRVRTPLTLLLYELVPLYKIAYLCTASVQGCPGGGFNSVAEFVSAIAVKVRN